MALPRTLLQSVLFVLVVLLLASCTGSSEDAADSTVAPTTAETTTTTTTVVPATTESTTTTTVAPATTAPTAGIEWIRDLPYYADREGLNTPVLDVSVPAGDGPWPIVVTYHPDDSMNSKSAMTHLAGLIAEQGAVVVNPTYGGPGAAADKFRTAVTQATCAVWYAIEHASEYGGDVSDVTLVGFSGGANMAAAVAMYPASDDTDCEASASDFELSKVVLFEGDFTLSPAWNEAIRSDPTFYPEMTVWEYIDGYAGYPIDVLIDTKTTIGIMGGVGEYLDLRHPDGPLREAWEALGILEADAATVVQVNTMLYDQLTAAGHEATLTTIEATNHSLSPTAETEIIRLVFEDA